MSFPLPRPAHLAILASGRGSNLHSILEAFPAGNSLAKVQLVISNKPHAAALQRAHAAGIDALYIPFGRDRDTFEGRVRDELDRRNIDLICLAGFMRVLSPAFVTRYRGRILNIHPSLLPRFPGLEAPRQALEAGAKESGCTVHFVDEGVDTGPPIVQRSVPVLPGDTPDTLAARILNEEHQAYPDAIRRVLTGRATPASEPGGHAEEPGA
ncbi:MAG TPA: phosphoribosylglycinamide formyltransferase [Trueperaceae bacterium]